MFLNIDLFITTVLRTFRKEQPIICPFSSRLENVSMQYLQLFFRHKHLAAHVRNFHPQFNPKVFKSFICETLEYR